MTAKWQAGHTYTPGSFVIPATAPAKQPGAVENGGFETGDLTGWSGDGTWSVEAGEAYSGQYSLKFIGSGIHSLTSTTKFAVYPGKHVGASVKYKVTHSHDSMDGGQIIIVWLDENGSEVGAIPGTTYGGEGGYYRELYAGGYAPSGAVSACIRLNANSDNSGGHGNFDAVLVDYTQPNAAKGLIYKATQAKPGKSGSSEPNWPGVTGVEVQDNEVTWEGVIASQIVWEASPLLQAGDTEPNWPVAAGGVVRDGTINWTAVTSQVTDDNCPNSKVVAIMASKVFAADGDIVRFSATTNPLDWTSEQNAGYLPTGLQQANANEMAVLAPYRSNLCTFNASSFQNWQVDPDPAAMAILDQMEGIGSTHQHAAQPVGNELFYLSQLGVRTVSIAGGADNLKAGDVGMPVDPLVQIAAAVDTTSLGPRATYYPSSGQFWLAFAGTAGPPAVDPLVYVCTLNAGKPKWSRYVFPWAIDAFAQLGNDLYTRHGDTISRVDEGAVDDDGTTFTGTVQWPWLDMGQAGATKMMEGFDIVASGDMSVSVGYDQLNANAFTAPYACGPDTLTGSVIPLPLMAPTFSPKLTFAGGEKWSVQSMTLYVNNQRGQP